MTKKKSKLFFKALIIAGIVALVHWLMHLLTGITFSIDMHTAVPIVGGVTALTVFLAVYYGDKI